MDCLISRTENDEYTILMIGFGGSPRILDIGGVPYLMPIADKSKVKHHAHILTYICVFVCVCCILTYICVFVCVCCTRMNFFIN